MSHSIRLTPSSMDLSPDYLDDYLALTMMNLEDALLRAGATPIQHYGYKDLMDWAVQLTASDDIGELKQDWTPKNPNDKQ